MPKHYKEMMDEIINKINEEDMEEDAPMNNVGGGNIAGVGVGPDGEPGIDMKKAKKKKKDNEDEQDKITRKIKTMLMNKEDFNNVPLSNVLDVMDKADSIIDEYNGIDNEIKFEETKEEDYKTFKEKYNG
jgi:hypothetical protein